MKFDTWGIEEWSEVYEKCLTSSISDAKRFNKAVEIYGPWNVYSAVHLAATRDLEGDPLSYVLTIAYSQWVQERREQEDMIRSQMRVDSAKLTTKEQGELLEHKIEKARQTIATTDTLHGRNGKGSHRRTSK